MYSSIATYETLNELKKQDLINFRLIYKRLSAEHNCIEKTRKFVAIVLKSNFLIYKKTKLEFSSTNAIITLRNLTSNSV